MESTGLSAPELWAVWVTAGATILASIVPLVLFLLERKARIAAQRALTEERNRAEKLELRALTAQARRVHLRAYQPVSTDEHGEVESLGYFNRVEAVNGLDDPIFDVKLGGVSVVRRRSDGEVVEPGETFSLFLVDHHMASDGYPPIWVEFTDIRGRRWRRHRDGTVTETTSATSVG
ncbi:hypothetical protein [Salana multivorans]|uniref:hypothetical protein n=1 Tax=Salana multivorans TaxID=120377 RepID=UPI0024900840|nr:hypothetical protein [Salana multivorans]